MSATIGLLGDVMLGRSVGDAVRSKSPQKVWAPEVREVAANCDALVCNLECCISERGRRTERLPGKPFFFRSPPSAIASLQAIGASAVGLANNHALDYEEEALADTLALLEAGSISPVGAGRGAAAARAGGEIEAGKVRIGLVAATDHPAEYTAGESSYGVAWAELRDGAPDWLLAELRRLRERCELVVASLHWGPNMSVRPERWQRKLAAELLAGGADVVVGHSAHVFHGVAWTADGLALYDLGDALDDYAVNRELRNDLGVIALWRPGADPELELVGLSLDFCVTRMARGEDAEWIAARLERACTELGSAVERLGEQRFAVRPA